jgi:hypothetical protein
MAKSNQGGIETFLPPVRPAGAVEAKSNQGGIETGSNRTIVGLKRKRETKRRLSV